ncbi:tripartite motif-containing protein 2-like isoform X2 [Periplaneta americana]
MSHVDMVEDLLQCHLCNKRLRRPKMLPCQHTFCLECLQGLAPPASKNLACPSCGLNVELQTAGPDGVLVLPPNLYLDSLLTALQQDNGGSAGVDKTRCSRCQTVGSTSACQHCRQVFCTVCWSSHISELKSQLPSLLDQLTGARERLDHRIQDFREVCQKLKQHIDVAVEVRIQSLRVQQSNMNKKAEELLAQGELSVAELQGRIHTTENTVARGADFDALPNDNKKVALFLQLHRTTSGLLDEVSHWGEARPTFDEENFRIDMAGESRTSSEPEEPDDVFCEAGPLSSADSMSLYYRSRSFTPRINLGRSVMQRPSGVGVAPWDDGVFMYIAGTDSRQVLVIDRSKMKLVTQLTAPSMLYPHGIAFCKTSREVYVTDKWNHCIHVFSAESKYLRQLGRKGHASGCFHSPEGIASGPGISEKTSLYVCDTGNDRVQVIDPSDGSVELILGILEPLPGQKTKRTQFNQPTGVAVTQDKVVVADFGNKRIKTYSLSGEKLNEFGSMGEARGQFRSPECIAVDRLGFILVGDSGNARVQIFRPNGTLVRVFGGRGSSAGRFAWVSGIAVTDSMDIIVTDSKNGNVQIF